MAKIPLSKSQLSKEKENLASYRRYLPALDLKRQQLMGERQRARREIDRLKDVVTQAAAAAGEAIPMMSDLRVDLDDLVAIGTMRLSTQNVAGVRLPVIAELEIIRKPYGRLVRPHWVDAVADRLAEAIRMRAEIGVAYQRLAALETAVTRVTQRVNLFDKVLIPQTAVNIRRINVYLGDAERAAVVGAKIAKRQREAQAAKT